MAIRQSLEDKENAPEKVGTRWTVRNPHPGFVEGDPNIINEFGHTRYPKSVPHPTKKQVHVWQTYISKDTRETNKVETNFPEMVIVNSEEEEKALYADAAAKPKIVPKTDKPSDWTK